MATLDSQTYQAEYVDGYQHGYVQGYHKGYQQGREEGRRQTIRLSIQKMRGWIRTQLARHMRQANPLTREVAAAILAQCGLIRPSGPPAPPVVSTHNHHLGCQLER